MAQLEKEISQAFQTALKGLYVDQLVSAADYTALVQKIGALDPVQVLGVTPSIDTEGLSARWTL